MRANKFEYDHRKLLHLLVIVVAFLTYLADRDNIVWRFVKDSAAPRTMERFFFLMAALAIAAGGGLCTWARILRRRDTSVVQGKNRDLRHLGYLGEFLFAVGLGSLAPLSGFIILVAGEALRLFRLMRREDDQTPASFQQAKPSPSLSTALRQEAGKWGMLFTMIVFVITLKDRLAEVLATASLLTGLLLNAPYFSQSHDQLEE